MRESCAKITATIQLEQTVNPERWQQVERIFHGALEREPHGRASFLDQACGTDSWLRDKLEALLRSHEGAGSFLVSPASPDNGNTANTAAPHPFVGQHLGLYEIKAHLGSGGMGDVYRARDTQLKRDVAIKMLPPEFSRDPDRVARFQREAVALAALNHPNIAAIHDLDTIDGTPFLVLEFVEGETLAARLRRGPLSVRQAVEVCKQIAEALEGAHAKGIHHRDLKPENVQITPDGRVKLLDFGLAKMLESPDGEGTGASGFQSITRWDTKPGVILGTAPYLSPEQARGQRPDRRSDIWAFGCVLFEVLTGKQTFAGATITDVFAGILKSEPEWRLLPPELPSSVRSLLRRCLEKEAGQRLIDVAHARMVLEDVLVEDLRTSPRAAGMKRFNRGVVVSAVVILAAGVAATLTWNYPPSAPVTASLVPPNLPVPPVPPVPRDRATTLSFTLPPGQQLLRTLMGVLAISPDGADIVYVANDRLYRRRVSSTETSTIPGADSALAPVFSPDGKWLAFWMFRDRTLKKMELSGGPPITLAPAPVAPSSLSWEGNTLVYAGTRGVFAVSASGGNPEVWVPTEPSELPNNPQILDGGNAILFSVTTSIGLDRWDNADIVLFSRKTGQRKILFHGGSDARYIPTGHIAYIVGNTLFAVPFDLKRQEITGSPVPILEGVLHRVMQITPETLRQRPGATAWPFGVAQFDYSRNGTLVYAPDAQANPEIRVVLNWFDQLKQRVPSR
jgi:serine/threonine protein kinase